MVAFSISVPSLPFWACYSNYKYTHIYYLLFLSQTILSLGSHFQAMSKFSRYFLDVVFQIMSFLTHRPIYLSLTLVTLYQDYCDIFSTSFQKYNLHIFMQNSAKNVIALTSHVESNIFYFPSLSWPILLYLSQQFLSCFCVTAVSYILVWPKSVVIATEKAISHWLWLLALPSTAPPLCHQYLYDCTANWTRKMSWVTKMTLPSLLAGSWTRLCAVGGIWKRQLDPVLCESHHDTSLRVHEKLTVFSSCKERPGSRAASFSAMCAALLWGTSVAI